MKYRRESFSMGLVVVAITVLMVSAVAVTAYSAADQKNAGPAHLPSGPSKVVERSAVEPIHNPAGSEMYAAPLTSVPTCDGYIDAAEWADANMYDVSDTTGQSDGIIDPLGTVILWLKQDMDGVYFAVRNNADTQLDDYDQIGLYFDDNYDGCWPVSATTEGNEWLEWHPTGIVATWRWWQDFDCGFPPTYNCTYDAVNIVGTWTPACFGIGIGPTGVVDYEAMIPYGAAPDWYLDLTMPPDSLGFYMYCYDSPTGNFHGEWPSQGYSTTFREPCYFGRLICGEEQEWPDHKMHFPQLPDEIGWDVNATAPKILADDWQCSETGWVTDIHFWGSWKNIDGMPNTDDVFTPMPFFQLSIHANLPVGHPQNPFDYSIPGELLWFWEGEIGGIPFDPPSFESWYDPNTDSSICNDHMAYWRYDFFFDNAYPVPDSFYQYKDSIYWLDISALYIQPPYQWGWKTSRDHFMDDAVYMDPGGPWIEMYEPPRCNWFDVYFDGTGTPEDWGSTNYYGAGWYEYEYWWNMWFYDNPFTYERPKEIFIDRLWVAVYGPQAYAEFAINWSTPEWDELEMGRPPLPSDGNEELYIGREIVGPLPLETLLDFNFTIPYNPEWISIDFRAWDVVINGWVYHECVPTSMDMAFVITGVPDTSVICGDVNNDGIVNVGDIVYLVSYLYRGGPAPIPMECVGDVNNDDVVNVGDVVYLVSYLYRSGPAPDPNCCNPPWKE